MAGNGPSRGLREYRILAIAGQVASVARSCPARGRVHPANRTTASTATLRTTERGGSPGLETQSVRCYGTTQVGNLRVRRFLDRLRIASVANGNKNWLSGQPLQVVKWIADLFP